MRINNNLLLPKHVLITGSTGGVGLFAHQLARQSGTYVIGIAHNARNEALVHEAGADYLRPDHQKKLWLM